ncbi:MAG: hypothetical protein ACD_75C02136G0001 [uncultured bacterium]|nr:MAG: hypothetical protein ACD_75C02136G0001 [uncultured bacterium]
MISRSVSSTISPGPAKPHTASTKTTLPPFSKKGKRFRPASPPSTNSTPGGSTISRNRSKTAGPAASAATKRLPMQMMHPVTGRDQS